MRRKLLFVLILVSLVLAGCSRAQVQNVEPQICSDREHMLESIETGQVNLALYEDSVKHMYEVIGVVSYATQIDVEKLAESLPARIHPDIPPAIPDIGCSLFARIIYLLVADIAIKSSFEYNYGADKNLTISAELLEELSKGNYPTINEYKEIVHRAITKAIRDNK